MKRKIKCWVAAVLVLSLVASNVLMNESNVIVSKAADTENNVANVGNEAKPKEGEIGSITDNQGILSVDTGSEQADLEVIDSGTCGKDGDNLIWELTTDGTLIISGEGDMTDYSPGWSNCSPWTGNSEIYNVIIANSVTSIGNNAFLDCRNVTNIIIPDSVISIGDFAFDTCTNLRNVTIPDSVNSIGRGLFINVAS